MREVGEQELQVHGRIERHIDEKGGTRKNRNG